ncbi:MAG: small subunit ribosomal protein S15 [Candidatus Paceibacteria bacterium]|jgi:small subunit ribosomal protein S15
MLTKRKKQTALKEVQRHDIDTGSPESQAGILTRQIEELAKHLKKNPKDNHSRRGLLGMVADRQKHLSYLERKSPKQYKTLVKKLGLKNRA